MGHMARSLCAGMLATEGRLKNHNSNGTICAVLNECVYMTCANSKDRITGLGCGKFAVVNKFTANMEVDGREQSTTDFRKGCVHWVLVTREAWDALNGALLAATKMHVTQTNTPTPAHNQNK